MTTTTIVVLISVILIVSVIVSIILNKREQAAAIKRQQVASFRFKADEAQDLFDGLQIAGLEKAAYQFLLDRIIENLKAAYEILPNAPGIKRRLNSAISARESLDSQTFAVQMPGNMMELHGLIGRLNKLMKYLMLLFQRKAITDQIYQQLMPSIQKSSTKFDVEGHIKMGYQAENSGQSGTAKQSYQHAKEKLLENGAEDAYSQRQLQKVEELLENLDGKSPSQETDSNKQPVQQEGQQPTEDVPVTDAEPINEEEAALQEAILTQEELNKQSIKNEGFAPKKKW